MAKKFSYKIFFERTFDPIALYKIENSVDNLTASDIRFIDVNPAYEYVNNVKREDLIGKTFEEVWPNVEPCWSDIIQGCLQNKRAVHCESKSVYTNHYLEAIAFPLADDMAATIFLDMTELKKSEEKLKETKKELLRYRAMLRELATELTLSEETTRREIATDIHDSIGHSLLTLLMDLRNLQRNCDLSQTALDSVNNAIQVAERMISESRHLIFELSPPILLEVGVAPAIEALADILLSPRGIKWTITTRGQEKDSMAEDAVSVILYRMSRELLINVLKHSKAKCVLISINHGPNSVQIVIEDDGIGLPEKFRLGQNASSGLGLFSIRERLIHIGGEMQIVSNKAGTTVSLLAPLKIK